MERLGQSCVTLKVGTAVDGSPRIETHHWANCKPVQFKEGETERQRATRGRKSLNPQAKPFKPIQPGSFEKIEPI